MRSRLWRRLGLTLVLASCTRPPVVPVPLVPATEADPTIEIRNGSLSNGFITVQLQLRRGLTGPRPVVISPITDDAWLLEAGAMLATYTVHWEQLRPLTQGTPAAAPASGRSYGKWLLTSPTADKVGSGYFAFIDYTAREAIPKVITYLLAQPETDPKRLAIAGHSTLGFTALQAIALEPRLRVAAILNACGDYHTFLRDSSVALDGQEPIALEPAYESWLSAREPIQHPERLTHTKLLMINGTADPAVPYSCAETTYATFTSAYRRQGARNRFKFLSLPDTGHELSAPARDAMRRWWRRWLLRSR